MKSPSRWVKGHLFSRHGTVLIGGIIVVFLMWAGFNQATRVTGTDSDPVAQMGQWGDKFGALNCLFAGLGFVGIVTTLVYQHEENTKKQIETQNLMHQLERTAAALETQAKMDIKRRHLDALVARIEGYTVQFEIYKADRAGGYAQQPGLAGLIREQDLLLHELHRLLNAVRTDAGGCEFTAADREAWLEQQRRR